MLAKHLLVLTEEFMAVDAEYERGQESGEGDHARSKDEIAGEYGDTLRLFLSGSTD